MGGLGILVLVFKNAHTTYHARKHKGEVDALMISLAGVIILAVLALIFVMVVGTSLENAKDMICDKILDEREGIEKVGGSLFGKIAGCGG